MPAPEAPIALLGDAHLREGDAEVPAFVRFVETLPRDIRTLAILGDLFAVWIGSPELQKPHHREVVAQVVREALTNVRRHSGSSICRVRMGFAARPFLIEVSDEGRGFADHGLAGYGLMGMRERAAGIGGRLEVVSTEGRGTTVFLFGPN